MNFRHEAGRQPGLAPVVANYSVTTAGGVPLVTVTCTATDACGASANCAFTVTVRRPVNPPCVPIGVAINGTNLEISWQGTATNIRLMQATNIFGPWTLFTGDTTNVNGTNRAVIPTTGSGTFFRLEDITNVLTN